MGETFYPLSRFVPKGEWKIFWTAGLTGAILLLLDQLTKHRVAHTIASGARITVIPGFFNLTFITNTGAAWGILAGKSWLLLAVSCAVFAAVLVFLRRLTAGWTERYFAVFLILSGIAGNSIDRIARGAVVDFLQFYAGKYYWPAFNVADSCICVGVGVFIFSTLLRPERRKRGSPAYVQHK